LFLSPKEQLSQLTRCILEQILELLFFQNEIFVQNRPENTKNGFSRVSLGREDGFYPILNHF
jgi:hypothetical protein